MVAVQLLSVLVAAVGVSAQTFRRTAACPKLGCLFPPDQVDFVPGQTFDIRVEVQAPVNGTEAYNGGKVNDKFSLKIAPEGGELTDVTQFFGIEDPKLESHNFTWFEDLYAKEAKTPSLVNAVSKSYRNVQLHNPGKYKVVLTFNDGETLEANWEVLKIDDCKKAKNMIFFIGDGMATSMISAARLLAHKMVNGRYQSSMALDGAPAYGSQMTHSLDSFITDSANSASAIFSGHKMTVNGLNAYTDSTGKGTNNAKVETVFEMFRRITGGQVGAVSKAFIADATPAAVCTHTSLRSEYDIVIEQYLAGVRTHPWFPWQGIDVLFGGGAENFIAGKGNNNVDQFDRWAEAGYQVGFNKTQLEAFNDEDRALAIFTRGNLSTWLDQHVYPDTLKHAIQPDGTQGAYDQPGLKDMTIKAIDILSNRAKKRGTGWTLMSEAALIDKEMHSMDVDRALGDLLELDDTVRATLKHLEEIGELEDTLVVVTADHGHGFDVFGSADTKYLRDKDEDRKKRDAIGVYRESGLSAYVVPKDVNPGNHSIFESPQGEGFPVTWDPRYTIATGWAAITDKREEFAVSVEHERIPSAKDKEKGEGYFFNPNDNPKGFEMTGNMDGSNGVGVHSLVDVPIYAWGPGHELFRGVMGNVDIAHRVAEALGLGRTENCTTEYKP